MKFKIALFSVLVLSVQSATARVSQLILSLHKSTANEEIVDAAKRLSEISESDVEYELDSKTILLSLPDNGESNTTAVLNKIKSLNIETVPVDKIMLGTQDDQK